MSCFTFTFSTRNHHLCSLPPSHFLEVLLHSSLGDKGSLLIHNEVSLTNYKSQPHSVSKYLQTLQGYQVVLFREPLVFVAEVSLTTDLTLWVACIDHLDLAHFFHQNGPLTPTYYQSQLPSTLLRYFIYIYLRYEIYPMVVTCCYSLQRYPPTPLPIFFMQQVSCPIILFSYYFLVASRKIIVNMYFHKLY